jgi:predicted phosphodiesterase
VRRTRTSVPPGPLKLTRIGLIGDVHTERAHLAHALERVSALGVDGILCTGDVVDGPYDVAETEECCALLRRYKVTTICGNHDRWLQDGEMRDLKGAIDPEEAPPEMLDFLGGLPPTAEIDTPIGKVLLCHGTGSDDMTGVQPFDHGLALETNEALQAILREGRFRYLISGHTHRQMVRVIGSLTLINAGTLLGDQTPCFSVLDFEQRRIQFYEIAADGTSKPGSEWEL